jgi:hydrogenase maturation protein HypF
MGRLFDAAAALLGVRTASSYEGQAAMELEALAGRAPGRVLPFPVRPGVDGAVALDPAPLLRALAGARAEGRPAAECAADFHASVAAATVSLASKLCDEASVDTVALGGGCFQNLRLLRSVRQGLEGRGFRVLRPRLLSPNDGAVSYGQAVVTAARLSQ